MAEVLIRTRSGQERFRLNDGPISVGREKSNDIVIADGKTSRKHALIEKQGEQWIITDLNSANGTYLHGERISRVIVRENDLFSIGGAQLVFTGIDKAPEEDDLEPRAMALLDRVNANIAANLAARNASRHANPVDAAAPGQEPHNMVTMDLHAISDAAQPPAPQRQIDRTEDLAVNERRTTMSCKSCGRAIAKNVTFCSDCVTKVAGGIATPAMIRADNLKLNSYVNQQPRSDHGGTHMQYIVIPFAAAITQHDGAAAAAQQLQSVIAGYAADNWEYVRLEQLETYIAGSSGCFGIGATPSRTTTISMIVFRR